MQKTCEGKWKKRIIGWINNQAPTSNPTHDFKHVQCELDGKLERMLVKEWSCNLSEIFSYKQFAPFSTNCSKGGTHVVTPGGKSSHGNFKCIWKGSGVELFAPIAPTKTNENPTKTYKL